jgi:MFS family permease
MDSTRSRTGIILCALRERNFRLFFIGQIISLVGSWMQQMAIGWLVYRLTRSPWWLGAVGFASQVPAFFLAPVAGVLADQMNRRRLLLLTQSAAMVQALALAVLAWLGLIHVWHLVLLGFFLGCVTAVDFPVRQSFLSDLLPAQVKLANAVALNAMMIHVARMIGPALAGVLVVAFGEKICFLLNALSYGAILVALCAIEPGQLQRKKKHSLGRELKDGLDYAFGFQPIRAILLLVTFISLLAMPYVVLMPLFAGERFLGTARTLGALMAASGTGALLGALCLAARPSPVGLEKQLVLTSALLGVSLCAFALCPLFWVCLPVLVAVGFATTIQITASSTILQLVVEEEKRGRVMSFFTMAFVGMVPFGNLLAGSVAQHIGAVKTLTLGGIGCVFVSCLFGAQLRQWRLLVYPIYQRRGVSATSLVRP